MRLPVRISGIGGVASNCSRPTLAYLLITLLGRTGQSNVNYIQTFSADDAGSGRLYTPVALASIVLGYLGPCVKNSNTTMPGGKQEPHRSGRNDLISYQPTGFSSDCYVTTLHP